MPIGYYFRCSYKPSKNLTLSFWYICTANLSLLYYINEKRFHPLQLILEHLDTTWNNKLFKAHNIISPLCTIFESHTLLFLSNESWMSFVRLRSVTCLYVSHIPYEISSSATECYACKKNGRVIMFYLFDMFSLLAILELSIQSYYPKHKPIGE